LKHLAAEGAAARGVIGVLPTVTYPSHTTMITGVRPAVHGIYTNRILDPEDRSNGAWYWYAEDIHAPTLVSAVRARGLHVAAIGWPVSVGMDADVLMPEFERSGHREGLEMLRALSRPSNLLDEASSAAEHPTPWPLTDQARADAAAWTIRQYRPDLLLLHLVGTDEAQHKYGPETPEAFAAIAAADRHVKTVLSALDDTGLRPQTDVVIVSDHGFVPIRQQLQVNAAFKQHGWIETDWSGRITSWRAYFHPSGGSAFVYVKEAPGAPIGEEVGALLHQLSHDPANGIARVMNADELRAAGADPRASYAVEMKPGFYTHEATDRLMAPTTNRGGHGYDPSEPELHASLIVSGPHAGTNDLGIVRMTQIAPTIASWFGVQLSRDADRPLELGK